ncbi:hypothetical protein HPB50_014182 [Hyalomma asiaticum]|uniref:Uncharacterized protein n=1 Tax=Hyalomma asiaticum TaxID=266040 RepID=A0ACB7SMF3_HYAAI|nr:hypothetical protein HPB50_014182 [Hyalomma asiaticum]
MRLQKAKNARNYLAWLPQWQANGSSKSSLDPSGTLEVAKQAAIGVALIDGRGSEICCGRKVAVRPCQKGRIIEKAARAPSPLPTVKVTVPLLTMVTKYLQMSRRVFRPP